MVSFGEIPNDVRTPGIHVEFDSSRALKGSPAQPHVALLVGQRLATGAVAALVPTLMTRPSQFDEYFGRGSQLARMGAAFKGVNEYTEVRAIALDDDAAGTAAAGTITMAGAPTKDGTLYLYVAGKRIPVPVTTADTSDTIATAIAAAINVETDLPATAAVDGVVTSEVDVTARNKGECGNYIDLRLNYYDGEQTPPGLTVTIVGMTGGAVNPDIGDALAAIGASQYATIGHPYTDATNLVALETELAARWTAMNQTEGHAFTAAAGSLAEMSALGNSRNSPFSTILPTNDSPSEPAVVAAMLAGVDAGEPDPARPRQTLALTGMMPPARGAVFLRSERDILLTDGISTFTVDSGGVCRVERLISTYQTNPQGLPDTAYLDVCTLRTLSRMRFDLRATFNLKYPRHKLADDGTDFAPGQAIITPSIGTAEVLRLARDEWVPQGLLENYEQFKKDLLLSRNTGDPSRLDGMLAPDLVNQFRLGAFLLQFIK